VEGSEIMPLLKDKVALITGAAAGIGEATARLFAEEGAHVVVYDRSGDDAESVARDIRAAGGSAFAVTGDVRDAATVKGAIDRAVAAHGHFDILVNNAGIYPRHAVLDITEQEWDEVLSVNLKGVFQCTRLALPHMIAQRSGKIVNISSVNFHLGNSNFSHYIASKGGIIGFTRALARELGPHNIHINAITPGAVQTEAEKRIATQAQVDAIVVRQCLERRVLPLDIARVCLFLASEWSDSITGQTINVDCGNALY
jgi:3-oxoacyl-[acyl-carrier protein] reductase